MDGSYFCFISLSTIGFGDIVPGDKIYGKGNDFYTEVFELSFVFCSIYLMLGMALIAMCFNLMQVRNNFPQCYLCKFELDDNFNIIHIFIIIISIIVFEIICKENLIENLPTIKLNISHINKF